MKKELLDRFGAAVDGLLAQVAKGDDAPPTEDPPGMTADQFAVYATEQVEAAGKDADKGVARLKHLKAQIEMLKNFEGSPAGVMPVTQFKDPGQVTTTESTQAPSSTQSGGPSNFAANDVPPAGTGARQPPGGQNPPLVAGGSGFDTAFSKAVEDLDKKLDALLKTDEPPKDEGDPKPEDKSPTAPVTKAEDLPEVWANDMSTDYGMGKTDEPDVPPWGFDTGSEALVKHEALQKAKDEAGKPKTEDKPAE